MRKVILFIAISLDGFIADQNGKVDWLNGQSDHEETLDSCSAFMETVDTVIMGWNTYHQIITELSPDQWIYQNMTSYVITHRELPSTDTIRFTQSDPCNVVRTQKRKTGKGIWICGGGTIIQPLIRNGLIDEYYISVIPTILGAGIRLFEENNTEIKLKLSRTQSYNGITELVYTPR
ncbi:MAG: dihydrofolate reductase [Oscillospiraceae bacterium]|nr:dihydrofolate reductase [Oscillospiraceae bacterium]